MTYAVRRGRPVRACLERTAGGIASHIPGYRRLRHGGTGGADSARYFYSIWLRHLVLAAGHAGMSAPSGVAELGSGDSVGTGLAALLCGAERYFAFDVIPFASLERNRAVFDELVELLRTRTPIPDVAEFPESWPPLPDCRFPAGIPTDERLAPTLAPERVARIRQAIRDTHRDGSTIRYVVPWHRRDLLQPGSVDMALSQAVMEHAADLSRTYL